MAGGSKTFRMTEITLEILNTAKDCIITDLNTSSYFTCFICKGKIKNRARVFIIKVPITSGGSYFFEHVHKRCHTTESVALKLLQ